MQLNPHAQRILVKRKMDEKTGGEIYIPETSKKVSLRGDVIAIGNDCEWIEVGDDIFFGRYAPFELPTHYYQDLKEQGEILIMNEEDVLCKVLDEPS